MLLSLATFMLANVTIADPALLKAVVRSRQRKIGGGLGEIVLNEVHFGPERCAKPSMPAYVHVATFTPDFDPHGMFQEGALTEMKV